MRDSNEDGGSVTGSDGSKAGFLHTNNRKSEEDQISDQRGDNGTVIQTGRTHDAKASVESRQHDHGSQTREGGEGGDDLHDGRRDTGRGVSPRLAVVTTARVVRMVL